MSNDSADKFPRTDQAANDNDPSFADDLLRGANEVGEFLGLNRRSVYFLAQNSRLPTFKLGSTICARRSVLLKWVADQEARRAQNNTAKHSK